MSASTSVSHSAPSQRAQLYSAHVRETLLPQLEATRHALALVEHDISEYDTLKNKVDELTQLDTGLDTLTELGAGVWVEARVDQVDRITLDLGLDLHLDMSLSEARGYISHKLELLKKKRDTLSKKEEHLVWQLGQFLGRSRTTPNDDPLKLKRSQTPSVIPTLIPQRPAYKCQPVTFIDSQGAGDGG